MSEKPDKFLAYNHGDINDLQTKFADILLREDLEKLIDDGDKEKIKSHILDIQPDLDSLFLEIQELDARRRELLEYDNLSVMENEELAMLNEIIDNILELESFIKFSPLLLQLNYPNSNFLFLYKRGLTKKQMNEFLENSDIESLNSNGINSFDLLNYIFREKLNENDSRLGVLKKLSLPEHIFDYFLDYPHFFLLLHKCNLTTKQRVKLADDVSKLPMMEKDYDNHTEVFFPLAEFLANIPLSKQQQQKMIYQMKLFTRFYIETFTSLSFASDAVKSYYLKNDIPLDTFLLKWLLDDATGTLHDLRSNVVNDVDSLLASKFLTKTQKMEIVDCIVLFGSPLDCKYILKNHHQFISKDAKKMIDEKMENIGDDGIKDIYELTQEDFKEKEIEIIIHPFYTSDLAFNKSLDGKEEKEGNEFIEKFFVDFLSDSIRSLKKDVSSNTIDENFIDVIEAWGEYQKFKKLSSRQDTVTIIVLPFGWNIKGLKDIIGNVETGSIFYMESKGPYTGHLKPHDLNFLNKVLPKDSELIVSGGYMGRCLSACTKDILSLKRRITIDHSDSVHWGSDIHDGYFKEYYDAYGGISDDKQDFWNLEPPKLSIPKNPIKTMKDVRNFMKDNEKFLEWYEEFQYMKNEKKDAPPSSAEYRVNHIQ